MITAKMLSLVLVYEVKEQTFNNKSTTIKSPGMKYRHYQPKVKLYIIDGTIKAIARFVNHQAKTSNKKIVVICPSTYVRLFKVKAVGLGSSKDYHKIAKNIYAALRKIDDLGIEVIYTKQLTKENFGAAIMN
jgi:L-threonylcarbamoyladenylate synthase